MPTQFNAWRMTMSKISPEHLTRGAYVYDIAAGTRDRCELLQDSRRKFRLQTPLEHGLVGDAHEVVAVVRGGRAHADS
jgi:hypothetical protein